MVSNVFFCLVLCVYFQKLHAATMTSLSDDPDTLLNEWLGELDNLIGVSTHIRSHTQWGYSTQL